MGTPTASTGSVRPALKVVFCKQLFQQQKEREHLGVRKVEAVPSTPLWQSTALAVGFKNASGTIYILNWTHSPFCPKVQNHYHSNISLLSGCDDNFQFLQGRHAAGSGSNRGTKEREVNQLNPNPKFKSYESQVCNSAFESYASQVCKLFAQEASRRRKSSEYIFLAPAFIEIYYSLYHFRFFNS